MGTSVYTSLLISDLRRRRGEFQKLQRQVKKVCRELAEKRAEIEALELVLKGRLPEAEIEAAPAIRTTPKTGGLAWNRLTTSVLSALREATEPVSSDAITRYVAETNELLIDDAQEIVLLQERVKKCLKRLASQGRAVRLHSALSNRYGIWKLPDTGIMTIEAAVFAAFFYFQARAWHLTIEDRLRSAPDSLTNLGDPMQLEIVGVGPDAEWRLVRYTGTCTVCAGEVRVLPGEPDFPRRMVGRCAQSPREHVFSFDRITLLGAPLIVPPTRLIRVDQLDRESLI